MAAGVPARSDEWFVRPAAFPYPASPTISTGSRRRGGQTHLVEQPPVRRTEPDQAVEPVLLLELPPDFEQLDVKLVGL